MGWFKTLDGRRCDPLTVTDAFSRFALVCRGLPRPIYAHVRPSFERAFREFGMPDSIRTDNGPPFASSGTAGLTQLSVWWIKLGIRPERITPGKPQESDRIVLAERASRRAFLDARDRAQACANPGTPSAGVSPPSARYARAQ